MEFKAAVIQYHVATGKIDANLILAEKFLRAAAADGAELLLLPEMFYCGFDMQNAANYVQTMNGEVVSMLRSVAADCKVFVVGGSIVERKKEGLFNTSVVLDRSGSIIAKYRKIHLFPRLSPSELDTFCSGNELCMFDFTKDGQSMRVGVATCFDLRYPEQFRNMSLRGVRLFAVPMSWAASRREQMICMCQSRACENVSYLLAANTTGGPYVGDSLIANPLGGIVANAENKEGYFTATIDTEFISNNNWMDTLQYRRPFVDEIDNNLL